MGKAEFGTAKHLSNQLKKKGLQKTKFYCQICMKQCMDDNGFKCHIQSPSHIKNLELKLSESNNNSKMLIQEYSDKFITDFLKLLRINHGEKYIGINRFYQEYIQDKDHVHLNSTKWKHLTSLVMYLKENGICNVSVNEELEDSDHEKYGIAYIDNSPESVARKQHAKEKKLKSDEEISLKLLREQIENGNQRKQQDIKESANDVKAISESLEPLENRDKIKISFGGGSSSPATTDTVKKPIMKCGMKIIPTDLSTGKEGEFVRSGEGNSKKPGLKLKSRFGANASSAVKVKSGNVFKLKNKKIEENLNETV